MANNDQFGVLPTLPSLFTMFSKRKKTAIMLHMNDRLDEPNVLMIFDELEVRTDVRKKIQSVKRVLVKTILRPKICQFTASITVP